MAHRLVAASASWVACRLLVILALVTMVIGAASLQLRRHRHIERAAPSEYRASRLRLYGMVNAIYLPLVFIAVLALGASGHAAWINPAIILMVGLHLFPLDRIFRDWLLHLGGGLLVALAISYPVAADPGSPVGLLGAGAILLATGAASIVADNSFKPSPLRRPA